MNLQSPQISASQFPQVYEDLGINPGKLGCLMLNTEPIQISGFILENDLYYADPDEHPHIQGIMSEGEGSSPHVTLLYGFLRSAIELKKHIETVLDGTDSGLEPWTPEDPTISEVSFFPSNDPGDNYVTLIAKLELTQNLMEANARLRLLPTIQTFSSYSPHITLAYVKDSSPYQGYTSTLNSLYQGKTVKALDLNYGD